MKCILIAAILVSLNSVAHNKHHRRQHKAHSHGYAELNIAFEGLVGRMELKSPAESIVGFEHQAKSEKDKTTLNTAVSDLENNISNYVQFDSASKCMISKSSVGMVIDRDHGHHADFIAKYTISCEKDLKGTQVTVDFTKYTKLKEINATILAQDLQLKTEIKSKKTIIDLK